MTFHRLIDRASIRWNPQAGNRDYFVAGASTAHLTIRGPQQQDLVIPPQVALTASGADMQVFLWDPSNPVCGDGAEIVQKLMQQYPREAQCELTYKQDIRHMHSIRPADPFLFNRAPCTVLCDECGCTFDASELETDISACCDFSNDKVCPKCGEWDCCELQLEQMSEAEMAKWADKNDPPKRDQEG